MIGGILADDEVPGPIVLFLLVHMMHLRLGGELMPEGGFDDENVLVHVAPAVRSRMPRDVKPRVGAFLRPPAAPV